MIPSLADALAERGFDTLTDVQQAVTAPELAQADLLVSAQTGSGKTVGFGLAIAPTLLGEDAHLAPPSTPLALIVAPTRELALQVSRELDWLYAKAGARVVSCIGGMDARDERRALDRGAHIVVGTPGRLRDHITRGTLDLASIRAVVLDEADEMLDLGFREDLEFILGEAPAERRTLLFSATVPPSIVELAGQYQRDAVRVITGSKGSQHADIAYQAVQVAAADAEHAIINLLRFHDAPTAIVFANTRTTVARLAARFSNRGFAVVSLSGELSQDERSHALQSLRDGRARVCVATDVAARGIDLPNLDLVIHADLPTNTEGLLHRSGRTGRAGRKGISALIVPDPIARKAARLLKWAKIEAEWTFAPSPEAIFARDRERLLADPVWQAEADPDETAFAAALLAQHGAETVAMACLRLYRARLSAPEDLNAPQCPRAESRAERAPFGPSVWIALSIGRDGGADPKWLLPMLCRTFNLEKAQIGKIRARAEDTVVEIAEAAVPRLRDRLGADGTLENGITARLLDAVPAEVLQPLRRGPRPEAPRNRPARVPQAPVRLADAPSEAETEVVRPQPLPAAVPPETPLAAPAAPPASPAPVSAPQAASAGSVREAPKERHKARRQTDAPSSPRPHEPARPKKPRHRPAGADRPARTADRPIRTAASAALRPENRSEAAHARPARTAASAAPRPENRSEGAHARPAEAPRKPRHKDKGRKEGQAPARQTPKSPASKPAGSRFRTGAADPSKPLDRPGRPRKGPAKGGDTPPRRKR